MRNSTNTIDYNAEIIRQLSRVVDNQTLQKKVLVYLKRIIAKEAMAEAYHPRTKEELAADFKIAINEATDYQKGKVQLGNAEDLINEL